MKSIYVGLTLFCLTFSSCSTHFCKIAGNKATLYLKNPEAQNVLFFYSLNGYVGQKLTQQKGLWAVTVPANNPFIYFYRIDGEIVLPSCAIKEKDDFGSENCIFETKF